MEKQRSLLLNLLCIGLIIHSLVGIIGLILQAMALRYDAEVSKYLITLVGEPLYGLVEWVFAPLWFIYFLAFLIVSYELLKRNEAARKWAVGLSILGIIYYLINTAFSYAMGGPYMRTAIISSFGSPSVSLWLWVVTIYLLRQPWVRDYFSHEPR